MSRRRLAPVLLAALGAVTLGLAAPPAQASEPIASWGTAALLPGFTSYLGQYGNVETLSERCSSIVRCTAYGTTGGTHGFIPELFVDEMVGGTWGAPEDVPGLDGLAPNGIDYANLDCLSPGNCVAYGSYHDEQLQQKAFVMTESDGVWGTPVDPPGLDAIGPWSLAWRVACTSLEDCVLGGDYDTANGHIRAFVDTERAGVWQSARTLTGTDLGGNHTPAVTNVTCASGGNCLVVGNTRLGTNNHVEVFVTEEERGVWHAPRLIPWLEARNALGDQITAADCPEAGWCTIAGNYLDKANDAHLFVDSEQSWRWGTPKLLRVSPFLPTDVDLAVKLQCPARAHCTLAGIEARGKPFTTSRVAVPYVEDVVGGTPGPLLALHDPVSGKAFSGVAFSVWLSCASWSNCGLGEEYAANKYGLTKDAVANEVHGAWTEPIRPASFVALSNAAGGNMIFFAVDCVLATACESTGLAGGQPWATG